MKKFFLLLFALVTSTGFAAQDRPNIIWLTSEDNSYHWLGCYGNKNAKTPNIDRLAAEGVRYKCTPMRMPPYAPSRASL